MHIAKVYFHCLFATTILVIVASESSRLPKSAIVADVQKPDGFCYNNDCSNSIAAAIETLSPNDPASRPVNTGFFATTIQPTFKSISVAIRSPMPYPISQFDDTGVFVLVNFLLAIFVYVIIWLSSDYPKPHVLERRTLHDALSRIKEQETRIQKLLANATDPAVIKQYIREIEILRNGNTALTAQLTAAIAANQRIEAELAEANSERATYQAKFQRTNSDNADLQNKYDTVTAENSSLKADLTFVYKQLKEANTRSADYIAELQAVQKTVRELETAISEEKDAKTELETECDHLKETVTSLKKEFEAKNRSNHEYANRIVKLYEQKAALERQVGVAASASSRATSSVKSNASNGWSDMYIDELDGPEDTAKVVDESVVKPRKPLKIAFLGKKAATPKTSTLKDSSFKIENSTSIDAVMEMEALRDTMHGIKVERDHLKRELANVEAVLGEKKAELEKAIAASDKCSAKNDQLEQLNADMYRKIGRFNEQYEKIIALTDTISALKLEKAASNTRVKELEKQLKKAEERVENLERKRYIDERKFKEKIAELEDHLAKAKVTQPSVNDGIGSGSSPNRESGKSKISPSAIASLWDGVDETDTSFDSYPASRSNGSRRQSDRFLPPVEPSGRRSVARRPDSHASTTRRSASRQRTAAASPYDQVPSGSNRRVSWTPTHYDEYDPERHFRTTSADIGSRQSSNGRRSTTSAYSSDRSSACYPPLASRYGIPPARKPASGVELKKVTLHKPAPPI